MKKNKGNHLEENSGTLDCDNANEVIIRHKGNEDDGNKRRPRRYDQSRWRRALVEDIDGEANVQVMAKDVLQTAGKR